MFLFPPLPLRATPNSPRLSPLALFLAAILFWVGVLCMPRASFGQSRTCEVCIPDDYAAACDQALNSARAAVRKADAEAGAAHGARIAHETALRDLRAAHEEIGRLNARADPWVWVATGAGGVIVVWVLVSIAR
jgi:hypothetical protein